MSFYFPALLQNDKNIDNSIASTTGILSSNQSMGFVKSDIVSLHRHTDQEKNEKTS